MKIWVTKHRGGPVGQILSNRERSRYYLFRFTDGKREAKPLMSAASPERLIAELEKM